MVVAIDFEVILVAYKCEVSSKCHYEVLDIMDYLFLYDLFIYGCKVTFSDFFRIDEVQEIFVLEHHDCFSGSCWIRKCIYEVIWKDGLVQKIVLLNNFHKTIHR